MIVLDTNIVSESSKPRPDAALQAWFRAQTFTDLYLCAPIVMEQSYGAEGFYLRTGSERYTRILDDMLSKDFRSRILDFNDVCAKKAGELRARRDRIGRPISIGDAIIAAICLVHGATLATRNGRAIDGLDMKRVNQFEAST